MADTSVALTPQTGRLPARDARDSKVFQAVVPAAAGARSGESAGHFRLYALPGEAQGSAGTAAARRMLTCPASWGEDGHSRGDRPGRHDFPVPAAVAPTWRPSGGTGGDQPVRPQP